MPRHFTSCHTVAEDGVSLCWRHYSVESASGRLLLIHPLAMDGSNWQLVVDALPVQIEVIAMDCRGHGRSGAGAAPFSPALFASGGAAVMADASWGNCVVAGCSMGGCVAQALAARHPKGVSGLVLIKTTAWYGDDASEAWAKRADRAKAEGLQAMLPFQRDLWFSQEFREDSPNRVAEAEAIFMRNDPNVYSRSCEMLGGADLRPLLSSIGCPTAVVVGTEDHATPPQAARALADAILGANLTLLNGARHFTPSSGRPTSRRRSLLSSPAFEGVMHDASRRYPRLPGRATGSRLPREKRRARLELGRAAARARPGGAG